MEFPNPRETPDDGLVGIGGNLQWHNLVTAYRLGIFPWPMDGYPLPWFCPRERAVLRFDELHVARSLSRAARRSTFELTIDRDFDGVIRSCAAAKRPEGPGTWITAEMRKAYNDLHKRGYAHSAETWREGRLVGGLYGVAVDGVYSGESMFHHVSNASKLALLHLIEHLRSRGAEWIDVQMMTPHIRALGGSLMPRDAYLDLLAATQKRNLQLFV
ncbi:MAG TPA: leucyl/phenylalanyl-tRNA--protein transferase [Thermoanaerobaculia bacterium]|nr:leucyl/phenylalanyl-tRNA--protein transferase [Thermoanaerobaculia bacterium]